MDIVDYSLLLRNLHRRIYLGLRGLIPIPGCPAKLVIATSKMEYRKLSKGSRVVSDAAAFTIPGHNLIVLNAPEMMPLQERGAYLNCCTITHEYVHIAMHNADDSLLGDASRRCRNRKREVMAAVQSQGWRTNKVDELITICCEWVYCRHPRDGISGDVEMVELGNMFIDLLGWVRPDE